MRTALPFALLLLNTLPLAADDAADRAKKAAELKAKIAKAEKDLAGLRAEMRALTEPATYHPVEDLLAKGYFEIGEEGAIVARSVTAAAITTGAAAKEAAASGFGYLTSVSVENGGDVQKHTVIMRIETGRGTPGDVIRRKLRVVGREKIGNTSYTVLAEAPGQKK